MSIGPIGRGAASAVTPAKAGVQGPGESTATRATAPDHDAKLRQVARDLEGVFVAELLKAMRETVPKDGLTNGGMGEDIFSSMLDQHLAPQVGEGWRGGIGEALYRQLRGSLAAGDNAGGNE